MSNIKQLIIKSKLSQVRILAEQFQWFCKKNKLDKQTSDLLELALVEAVNNIIIHAYKQNPSYEIHVTFEISSKQLTIKLTDFGKRFHQKTNNINNELQDGNWGIHLIKTISDQVIRTRDKDMNTLIITKNLSQK